jgi:hypothetical protein
MQYNTFKQILQTYKAGRRVCYHRGELALDRMFNPEVEMKARLAMACYDLGLVVLFQKREHGVMSYYLVLMRKMRQTDSRISFEDAERIASA